MDGQSSLILTGAQVRGHLGAFLLNLQSFLLPPTPLSSHVVAYQDSVERWRGTRARPAPPGHYQPHLLPLHLTRLSEIARSAVTNGTFSGIKNQVEGSHWYFSTYFTQFVSTR